LRKELIEGGYPKLSIEEARELQKKKKTQGVKDYRANPKNKEAVQRSNKKNKTRRNGKDGKFVF
jgi:hypothetical protein